MNHAVSTFVTRHDLYRSEDGQMIAGVCAGLGERFGIDPWILRVGLIVSALCGGLAIIVYAIAWIVLPVETEAQLNATDSGQLVL